MTESAILTGIVLLILFAFIDFYYGIRSFRQPEEIGLYLGLAGMFAGIITLSYTFSILTPAYRCMSVMSSVYFICIDWLLVTLLHFVYRITGSHKLKSTITIRSAICVVAAIDTLILVTNIFTEIAVSYQRRGYGIASYVYEMKPPYYAHLAFTYCLVVLILTILVIKCARTPRQYMNQYALIILAIVLIVVINAVFLFLDGNIIVTKVDLSIAGYSLGLYLLYWAAFEYRHKDMLKSLSMTIFENIDQGIVLFDHNQKLIMRNKRAEQLLKDVQFSESMHQESFMDECRVPENVRENTDHFSIQCETSEKQSQPLRCDYRLLRDEQGEPIGNLYVFTDSSSHIDLLTGFQHWEVHRRFIAENPYSFTHPTTVVVFDISGLGEINQTFGREVGNQQIRNLSRLMMKTLPTDTHFVRGYEAHLVAICQGHPESEIAEYVRAIVSAGSGTILYGMSSTVDFSQTALRDFEESETSDLLKTIDAASRALQVKKLLSKKSPHSHTLTSLVRALQESDSETEEHVQRTQKTGIALGQRIGLTDSQLADLRLLCLLHDVGKIGIPLEILNKPGKLSDAEWKVLKTHPEKGYQIAMSSSDLNPIARMILYHHERWDGKGYPEGLAGNSIPLLSRVISIVDSYDAMVNDRAYRKALTPEQAQDEIRRNAGTQFDPALAAAFLEMLEENPEIALGERTGNNDVRLFTDSAIAPDYDGKTYPIPYSRYRLNIDDVIIEIDEFFEELTGYSAKDVIGRMSQYDLVPQEDRAYYMAQVSKQFSLHNVAYLTHELLRKDGTRIWVICYGKRYYDSAEKSYRSEILIFKSRAPELPKE